MICLILVNGDLVRSSLRRMIWAQWYKHVYPVKRLLSSAPYCKMEMCMSLQHNIKFGCIKLLVIWFLPINFVVSPGCSTCCLNCIFFTFKEMSGMMGRMAHPCLPLVVANLVWWTLATDGEVCSFFPSEYMICSYPLSDQLLKKSANCWKKVRHLVISVSWCF